MNLTSSTFTRRFLALLTILSLAFTQSLPAWAMRAAGVEGSSKAGLEDALLTGTAPSPELTTAQIRAATLEEMVSYFSARPDWVAVLEQEDQALASQLVTMLTNAMRGDPGVPLPVTVALADPENYLPLALRLIAPADPALHRKIDAEWEGLKKECALCAAHILHENLEGTTRRDLAGHPMRDLLSAVMTAFDAKRLGTIPTRSVKPLAGHKEDRVVTQTAYSVALVGGFDTVEVGPGAGGAPDDLIRALQQLLHRQPDQKQDRIPAVHVRTAGTRGDLPANHYVGILSVDFGRDKIVVLDNGDTVELTRKQFMQRYRPTGLLFLTPEQSWILDSRGMPFRRLLEDELLQFTGDCGTCGFKGDFPLGYHAPIAWALQSAERLLYRGADGGTVQVRYTVGDQLFMRFYRVAYNSTIQRLSFKVAEIGPDQRERVLHEKSFDVMEAANKFGVKPDKMKGNMARLLSDLANTREYKISPSAKILDVVTHFRWATHGPSDIWGTHPHEARPDEIQRPGGEPTINVTVTVAHNGIIYDFQDLRNQLTVQGHTFETAVDTESFAHLLWNILDQEKPSSLLEAVQKALERIQSNDTYGFQITSTNFPDEIVSARNESPIYLGISDGSIDGSVPFFLVAADPKAILPHAGIYSTLLPDRAIVQVKNNRMTVTDANGKPFALISPDGSPSFGERAADGRMVTLPAVYVQPLDKETKQPMGSPERVAVLSKVHVGLLKEGNLKLFSAKDGQVGAEMGAVLFQKGKDQPRIYDLRNPRTGELYDSYTEKELDEAGDGIVSTVNRNTVRVPVYYIPREMKKALKGGPVVAYRSGDVPNRSNPQAIILSAEQAASIAGEQEWTELIEVNEEYAFVKLLPDPLIPSPWYDVLEMPEFSGIPRQRWATDLGKVDEVWLMSVGSSNASDMDGVRFIRRYAQIPTHTWNADDLRDDEDWSFQARPYSTIAVLATTQSGTTAVTKQNIQKIKKASGKPEGNYTKYITIADTNTPGSDITQPDYTEMEITEALFSEIGVLSTKAYHSQKVNKELFGMRLAIHRRTMRAEEVHERIQQLRTIGTQVNWVVRNPQVQELMQFLSRDLVHTPNVCLICYRGSIEGSVTEIRIKMEEGGRVNAKTFHLATFLHGPAQILEFAKVAVGQVAQTEAHYDPSVGQIIYQTHYAPAPAEAELEGVPILVLYFPEEGDQAVRNRLESNLQTVTSRGANIYMVTSPQYALELSQKRVKKPDGSLSDTPLVRRAVGIPANPYTLPAFGQKEAIVIADFKNQFLAEKIFQRAQTVRNIQMSAQAPPGFSSREDALRQALVETYREIVWLRDNGWLPQAVYPQDVGYILSKVNEAAQHPEGETLVTQVGNLLATMVRYIDKNNPGNLAKSVTVEAGLEEAFTMQGALGEMDVMTHGNPAARTVLIYLHGLAGDANDKVALWIDEIEMDVLRVRYTSSRHQRHTPPDYKGDRIDYIFGQRGTPQAKTFEQEVDDLRQVIQAVIDRSGGTALNVVLVGRSLGGQIVPIVANEFPQVVKGVVSIVGAMQTFSGSGIPPETWHDVVRSPPVQEIAERFSKYTGPMLVIRATNDLPARNASAADWVTYAKGLVTIKDVEDVHYFTNPSTKDPIQTAIRNFVLQIDPGAIPSDKQAGLEEIPLREAVDISRVQIVDPKGQLSRIAQAPTLGQWQAALQNDAQAAVVLAEPHYPADMIPAKRQQILRWLERLTQLQTPQGKSAFPLDRPTVITRTPGRFPDPPAGPHLDLPGFMGGSLGFPTREELVTFVQVVDGLKGAVEIYVAEAPGDVEKDYEAGPRMFHLSREWVNPPESIHSLEDWERWATQTIEKRKQDYPGKEKFNYAEDMIAALIAIMKTEFGIPDPATRDKAKEFFKRFVDEGKILRIGIASDLPAGGGMSSSSAVLIAIAQAINVLADLGLTPDQLTHLGWAERVYTWVLAGTKDHAHILNPPAYLGILPTHVKAHLPPIPGFDLVALDSGIARKNAPDFSGKLRQPGNDEQNIKGRSGAGYALGVLWIRRLIRQLGNGTLQFSPQALQNPFLAWIQEPANREKLKAGLRVGEDTANLVGFLRELLPGGKIGLDPPLLYGLLKIFPEKGLSPQELRSAFEDPALADLENELNTVLYGRPQPLPEYRYPIREMVLFALASEARNEEAAQIRQQLGKGASAEEVFEKLAPIVRTQHNADRIVKYEIHGSLDGEIRLKRAEWDWHMPDERLDELIILSSAGAPQAALWRQPGWMERSIEPLDRLVDLIEFFNQEIRKEQRQRGEPETHDVAVAQLIGAGLGGVVAVLVKSEYLDRLKEFLSGVYYRSFLKWSPNQEVPAKVMRPGRPASVLSLPKAAAGLEGIRRFATHLDGRWRMRNHRFTEVAWTYVNRDEQGRVDYWNPIPLAAAGLEEIPPTANPLSIQYQPSAYQIVSPMNQFTPPPVFDGTNFDPAGVLDELERTYRATGQGHISIRYPLNRVAGQGKLWDKIPDKEKLEAVYGLQYDLFEQRKEDVLNDQAIQQVVASLNDPSRAVASAARDAIVSVRAYCLTETLKRLTTEYSAQSAGFGSYARVSWQDAMTTFIDPATQTELGNPYRPLFDPEPNVEQIHQNLRLLLDVEDLERRDTWLKSFSGIRGPFSLAFGRNGSIVFPVADDLKTDIGSQIMDAAKVATAHILREFVRLLPTLPREKGGVEPGKRLRIGVLMDPRYTGPAIAQAIIRTLSHMGIDVVFGGIGSAPETAAYALLSEGKVDAAVLISSSHVQEGTNGFKLMVSNGQILPQDVARSFIKSFAESGKNIENTRELIQLLSDPTMDARVEEVMRGMPVIYAESKERYDHYGDQVISGEFENDARMQEIKQRIRQQLEDEKVVVLYDPNGGSGVADMEFLRSWAPRLITLNDQARHFAHDLAPQEVSTRQAKDVVEKLGQELRKRGYTVLIFGTDTDRDRRFMLLRIPTDKPDQPREYIYPGPQALFILDALYHVLTNQRAGKNKVAIVGNEPTTPLVEILAPLMDYEWKKGEVGEANVVAVMREFIEKGYEVMGGEGSNASTIRYPVMVRDMLLALGSVFGFMGKNGPALVRDLIELVVKDEAEKGRLQDQVDEWFQPENRADLFYHILYDILPPAAVTDTFDVSEQRNGISLPQRDFKNALDKVVEDQLGVEIRSAVAQEIGRVTGKSVSHTQVQYQIVNYEGTDRLEGAGNRNTNEGGYLVELYYTDEAGKHYLGWLWTRESQTELGTARRIVALVADFLPRVQARELVNSLYNVLCPKWIDALNAAEALALWRILSRPASQAQVEKLARLTEETRGGTRQRFDERKKKHTDPSKPTDYSANITKNLKEEKLRVEAAHWMLNWVSSRAREPLSAISQIGAEIQGAGQILPDHVQRLKEQIATLRSRLHVTVRENFHIAAQELALWSYQQVMERVLAGLREDQLTETTDQAQVASVVQQIGTLHDIYQAIAAIARQPRDRYAHVHLVVGETLLAGAKAAAGLEEGTMVETPTRRVALRPSEVRRNLVHIFDPEMAEMGLLVAKIQKDPIVIIAADFKQAEWLMDEGIRGDGRRILLKGNRTIEDARKVAAALFGEFTPRIYPAQGREQPNTWIAWVLEHYDVTDLPTSAVKSPF